MKPLNSAYLDAFCNWIEDYLLPKFIHANDAIKHILAKMIDEKERDAMITMMKREVRDQCSRTEFRKWCKEKDIRLSAL
jgi:2-hydroxy-3-keto-5-methylthiopentenyl-1-phosphate phosphatase